MNFLQKHPEGAVLRVFIQPRSSKNMIAGRHGDDLKVKLTAPPVDGAANKMCVKYLAKVLGASKAALEILSGHTSRRKRVLIRLPDRGEREAAWERLKKKCEKFSNF
ncbi:MAG: YggU family protein [Desulfobacterales bacterium]|nr:YggU family protein [Desulfobacterales bacterium]